MGTNGIRTARHTDGAGWAKTGKFDDWQMPPTPGDVARTVRGIVDREDAPQSLAVAYREPGSRAAVMAAVEEEYVSDVHTLDETAAALEYLRPLLKPETKTIALFDIGESGLVVEIVDVESGRSYGGTRSPIIGGIEFDRVVAGHILALGVYRTPTTHDDDQALMAFCRGIKEALSTHESARTPGGDMTLLERRIFELSIARPVEDAADLVRVLGLQAEFYPETVVAIGGSARIPFVAVVLGRYLGLPIFVPDAPELVIARGAALHAARIDSIPAPTPLRRRISVPRFAAIALPVAAVLASIIMVAAGSFGNTEQPLGTQLLSGDEASSTSAPPTSSSAFPSTALPPRDPAPVPSPSTLPAPAPAPAPAPRGNYNQYVPPAPPPPPTLQLPLIPGVQLPVIPLPVLPRLPFG